MIIPRIYHPHPLSIGSEISLESQASQHLLKVLRLHRNEPVILFNGRGGEYRGVLIKTDKHIAIVSLHDFYDVDNESPLRLHLLQGISKGERMDYVMQKAVELGVASITPVLTARCNVKLSPERLEKRFIHWQNVMISACEQSGRCIVPTLKPVITLSDWFGANCSLTLLCDPMIKSDEFNEPITELSLLIGPEGGFTADEIVLAKQQGIRNLNLGPRILRTETACVVAISVLQAKFGDIV